MTRPSLPLLFASFLLLGPSLGAQDPALKDLLVQAKAAWATQGDRDGAASRFAQILAALEPAAPNLSAPWKQVLCEAYNWSAVLEDRVPATRARAPKRLEAMLDLNPDFDIDRSITNARLQGVFDALRASKLVRLKLTLDPPGGTLSVDGTPKPASDPVRYLTPGPHAVAYAKPGYRTQEVQITLSLKEGKALDLKLERTSSAITVFTSPSGAQLLVDGKPAGRTQGQARPEHQAYADKAGVRLDQMSDGFVLTDLGPGKHTLEVKLSCYRSRLLEIGEKLTTPFADHDLEAVRLEPSRGFLTLTTPAAGGELFLSGQPMGPVPVKELQVCAEPYDLLVRFPSGSFTQRIEIQEGKSLTLSVRPKPRLAYAGFEGEAAFAGRDRILGKLSELGSRLTQVAFLKANPGETPEACLARLRASREAELVLRARPVPGTPIHQVELILSTLTGEEERWVVKALENDPLGSLVDRMERQPVLTEPGTGLVLLDLPGLEGPLVFQADATAQRAGIKPLKPLLQAGGKPVATVQDFRKALQEAQGGRITVSQGETPGVLPVLPQALELPTASPDLCYPFLLADLRLRSLGASGDEAGLLRLQQGLALMHFREYDKALEVLRDTRLARVQGVSQGTLDYYTGVCLLRMGNVYLAEAQQAFQQALKYPQATLFGPDGPLVAPLARQALEDLKP